MNEWTEEQIYFAARALALANPEDYEDKTHKGSLRPNQKAKEAALMALSAASRHSRSTDFNDRETDKHR